LSSINNDLIQTFTDKETPSRAAQLEIQKIDSLYMSDSWSEQVWSKLWENFQGYKILILRQGGELVGFCLILQSDVIHLLKIAISEKERCKGLGAKLLREVLECADREKLGVFLEVRELNRPAVNLYLKLGFELISTAKSFYRDGATALKMLRSKKND